MITGTAMEKSSENDCQSSTASASTMSSSTPCLSNTSAASTIIATKPTADTVIQLNDTKAGMAGLDVASINAKINQLSKGSKFYEHKLKQQTEVERKIQDMKQKLRGFSDISIRDSEIEMNKYGELLENSRDYSRFIVHIDMDAFYASVEMRDNPALRDIPMAVGGDSMLSTSNYLARRFGVRAAMPGFIAKKLCPQLVIVPCNFDKYRTVSAQIQDVLKNYDPNFSCVSLDEAYLDITEYLDASDNDDSPEKIVQEIRSKIFEETQLTASAGIASNGFLAKICGDICKPNNQYYLEKTRAAEDKFVSSLPIRKVNGIGGTMEKLLQGLEISTVEDIWRKRAIINLVFKPITAKWLIRISKGYQDPLDSHYFGDSDRKSISCERTLDRGTQDVELMLNLLHKCADELASELKSREVRCRSVAIKIKTVTFVVKSRSCNLVNFTSKAEDIFSAAKGLLEGFIREDKKLCLRLLGIRVTKWEKRDSDAAENDEPPSKQLKIEEAFAKVVPKQSYDCPVCNLSFPTERAVEVHLDKCLSGPPNTAVPIAIAPSGQSVEKPKTNSNIKTFTCPICQNVIQSLVENVEIASSDHVNYCISLDGQTTKDSLLGCDQTWKFLEA